MIGLMARRLAPPLAETEKASAAAASGQDTPSHPPPFSATDHPWDALWRVQRLATTGIHRAREAGNHVNRVVNPVRAWCGAVAVLGIVLVLWNFVTIRADDQWNYHGWTCRGWLPLTIILGGLILTVVGAYLAREWNFDRWLRWRLARRINHSPTSERPADAAFPGT